jgi:hypothetical protein
MGHVTLTKWCPIAAVVVLDKDHAHRNAVADDANCVPGQAAQRRALVDHASKQLRQRDPEVRVGAVRIALELNENAVVRTDGRCSRDTKHNDVGANFHSLVRFKRILLTGFSKCSLASLGPTRGNNVMNKRPPAGVGPSILIALNSRKLPRRVSLGAF